MNPLHQVPTLDDNGFFVTDSHAILTYLASNTHLISTDRRLQARINQILFFDFELFKIFCEIGVSIDLELIDVHRCSFRLLLTLFISDSTSFEHGDGRAITKSAKNSARTIGSFGIVSHGTSMDHRWIHDGCRYFRSRNILCNLCESMKLNFKSLKLSVCSNERLHISFRIQHCPIDLKQYSETLKWFEHCKAALVGYKDIEDDSKDALGNFLKSKGVKL